MSVVPRLCVLSILCAATATGTAVGQAQDDLLPDFTKPFFGFGAITGERPMVTILWDPRRADHPAPARDKVEELLFGEEHALRGYFLENSNGLFTLTNAGVLGWYEADKAGDHYWGPPDEGDQDGDGWVSGHTEKWAEAVRKADAEFDFAAYDTDGDSVLAVGELGVHIVIPQNNPFGTNRQPAGRQHPEWEPLVVDGVTIPVIAESYIGAPPNLPLVAHELAHLFLGAPDEYFWFAHPHAAGPFSLMDSQGYCSHLDPFLKLRLGWARPIFVTSEGHYTLLDVERHSEVLVLCDPSRTASEYFLIENRWPEGTYEHALPDRGLAIWHIIDDAELLAELPAPGGCDAEKWSEVDPHDWGRRAMRMIRPVLGPPLDNTRALWDGTDPETGYDLLSIDPNPDHTTLTWADGSPSGFSIRDIPSAGPEMSIHIDR